MISVIIPNWNGETTLPECLDSLRKQSFNDVEIVVVDNGSTDRSLEILRNQYPEVSLSCLAKNTGFTGACNHGISRAKGELIALFNNDMIAAPDWLERLFEASERNPETSMFASRIFWKDEADKLFSAGDLLLKGGKSLGRGHNQPCGPEYEKETEIFGACAGAALYRRSFFQDVGLFDEDFFAYLEDTDLNFRGRLMGHKCLYVPSAVTHHYGMHSLKDRTDLRVGYCFRNYFFFMMKNYPSGLFRDHFREIWKTLWGEVAYSFSHFRCTAGILHACRLFAKISWDVLKKTPSMLGKRKKVQGARRVELDEIRTLFSG